VSARSGLARRQIILVSILFLGPLLVATLMYYSDFSGLPVGRTNNGHLLTPIENMYDEGGQNSQTILSDGENEGRWLLIYLNAGECDDTCRDALYRLRQSRLMLGNEMARVRRVFLHGASAPDTLFLDEEHRGLVTINDPDLGDFLRAKRPQELPPGGLFLVDPLGNLVMYFSAELAPRDMVKDIKHLLELSQIG